MVYGTDPFSAQNATNTGAASIFGALPYPGSASSVDPPIYSLVTLRFMSLNPSILNCSVVGPNNGIYYRIVTDASAPGITLVINAAGQNIALVEWRSHPTVEAQVIGAKLHVGQWLRLSPDRRSRTLTHGGIHYAWAPCDRFLQLFAPGSPEWFARVTKHHDAFVLELSARAVQLGLIDAAVLATMLMQSGRNID
ncbi:hypothetical protein V8E55_007743 [Tylopilus felleus]